MVDLGCVLLWHFSDELSYPPLVPRWVGKPAFPIAIRPVFGLLQVRGAACRRSLVDLITVSHIHVDMSSCCGPILSRLSNHDYGVVYPDLAVKDTSVRPFVQFNNFCIEDILQKIDLLFDTPNH